tara:strand:- start:1661 stop:1900 length:240 start_codon:yes stop_codon:yes gene_type:complete
MSKNYSTSYGLTNGTLFFEFRITNGVDGRQYFYLRVYVKIAGEVFETESYDKSMKFGREFYSKLQEKNFVEYDTKQFYM